MVTPSSAFVARARARSGEGRGRTRGATTTTRARANADALAPGKHANKGNKATTTTKGSNAIAPVVRKTNAPSTVAVAGGCAAAIAALAIVATQTRGGKKQRKIVIAGAPASGKGTQCEMIVKKFGITHISAGDLLRAAVAQGTPAGKQAKEFMDRGDLVPNEVVVNMVKERLSQPDCAKGWLLDGYPRSEEQAQALQESGIEPDLFLLLDVPDEILIDRVVGRRLDPVDGTIYHLTYFPPPTPEIAARLTQRSDDTKEKAANRLAVHHRNVDAVVGKYEKIIQNIDGNRAKGEVFKDIERLIKAM